ncbi:alpha/beta fold hydrolase [Hymenobacter perfusus]|uniref:Alpha/beta hydrolase n=1 Tax=Hymenobacter perfusus TaxID=1236770 RepID=A0A3R9UR95_9BACT|nr:alpha/beta hydrolase [Hymenobacter perfusus]RSK38455.1 alpha/beta hydrolase [Hymenobacter perfusus]
MIHGRGQASQQPEQLKQAWLAALRRGCDRGQVQLPADTVVEFPYYGDLLASLVAQVGTPLGRELRAKGAMPTPNEALQGEILMEIAARAGLRDSDIRLEAGNLPIQKGPANWEWVQAIVRGLDHIPGLNSRLIEAFTRDVHVYLTYAGVRAQIDQVIAAALGDDPCVVVAHSLGSVVAYNVLRTRLATPRYPQLVTVGSPLGIRAIKQQLATPLVSPPCIGQWFNAYDDRDVVALVPLDEERFNVTPPIENKGDVLNFTENRHGIEGYLADPVVAQRIVLGLQGG